MKDIKELYQAIRADLANDEEFVKAFVSAGDAETLRNVLADKGYHVTVDDVNEMFRQGAAGIAQSMENGGELSAEQLEDVAGGGFIRGTLRLAGTCVVAFGYGALCGICPAAYAGTPYLAVGLAVWTAAGYAKKGW